MNQWILKAVAVAALSTALLCADTGHGTPGTPPTTEQTVAGLVARLTALLTLTSAQQTQATTIFTTEQTAVAALDTSLTAARTALETAITNNDHTNIVAQSTTIGNLTAQKVQAEATASAAFYAILTTDQQTKYKSLKQVGGGGLDPFGPGFGGLH